VSPERIERKLAAILAADLAGYSRLIGADEEGTLKRLKAHRKELIDPKIAEHQGRVVKVTGDGILIEFPSAVAALRCAVDVQHAMAERNASEPEDRRIEFRVGLHQGDIVVEDGDILGDGVNVAARLEGLAEPGAICVSQRIQEDALGKVDVIFEDIGEQQLKNIARPVRVYALKPGGVASAAAAAPEKREPPRLSLVVLPFANFGGGPEQDYFVDGVTESLTTDLSRISGAFVIGRSTAFTYKGKAVDLKQIGRGLNVRYVLEGSAQRAGNRLRVNVQLIEAETGAHLWAERFDKPVADLFEMQDEIVARLANQLQAELVAAEARRAERTPNPDSRDLYFQGLAWLNKGSNPDNITQARGFFDRALAADPGNVDALIGSARADTLAGAFLFVADPAAALVAAEAKLTKALSSVPDDARGHMLLGLVDILTKRAAQGIAECEHALALDRNLANAHSTIGTGKIYVGRPKKRRLTSSRPCASVRAIRRLTAG
jgi:TolB-like protein